MLEYIPRKQIVDRLKDGWRLIPGFEYRPGDYAILMARPSSPEPLSAGRIRSIAIRFEPRCKGWSNKSQAASSRQIARQAKVFERLLLQGEGQ